VQKEFNLPRGSKILPPTSAAMSLSYDAITVCEKNSVILTDVVVF